MENRKKKTIDKNMLRYHNNVIGNLLNYRKTLKENVIVFFNKDYKKKKKTRWQEITD